MKQAPCYPIASQFTFPWNFSSAGHRMLQSPSTSTKLKGENLFNYISLENSGTNIVFSWEVTKPLV